MPAFHTSVAEITPIVHEFLLVEIKDRAFENTFFEYRILDKNQHVLRKGNFTGLAIQLRLAHLEDGMYSFEMSTLGSDPVAYSFEKRSPDSSDVIVIRTYQ